MARRLNGWSSALVAQRALEPGSKLAATTWAAERVVVDGLTGFSDDQAYRAMDFLLEALGEIAGGVFTSVAHLLNLDLDIVFVDTTSTYWVTGQVWAAWRLDRVWAVSMMSGCLVIRPLLSCAGGSGSVTL